MSWSRYVDRFALEPGLQASLEPGVLYQASNTAGAFSGVRADLALPPVGAPGSLGFNANLRVDGHAPYVKSLALVLPSDSFDPAHSAESADDDGLDAALSRDDDDAVRQRATARRVELAGRAGRVATLTTGDVLFARVAFSGPVHVRGNPRLRVGLDGDDGRPVVGLDGRVAGPNGDVDGDTVNDAGDEDYATGAYGSAYASGVAGSELDALSGEAGGGFGVVVRWFDYFNGTNTSSLLFKYTVETGDLCAGRLDYRADERKLRSSAGSFDASRGVVASASFKPTLLADLHLNPAGGALKPTPQGNLATDAGYALADATVGKGSLDVRPGGPSTPAQLAVGFATFEALAVIQRGPDYRLVFESVPYDLPYTLATSTAASGPLEVEYACEFEFENHDREAGDGFGSSVDVAGDLMASGAPRKHVDVKEVQYVRTKADAAREVFEIQVIGVAAVSQAEVQTFHTTAAPHHSVGGSFTLRYVDERGEDRGTTVDLLADAPAETVKVELERSFPHLGAIAVSRTPYTWCACDDAYSWTVTFSVATGDVQLLLADGAGLTGMRSGVSDPVALQESPWLNGTFRLAATARGGDRHYVDQDGDGYNNSRPELGPVGANYSVGGSGGGEPVWTRPIPVDASPLSLKAALEEDLGMAVHAIAVAHEDDANGRQFVVTFASQRTGLGLDFGSDASGDDDTYGEYDAYGGGGGVSRAKLRGLTNRSGCVDNDVLQLVGDPSGLGGGGAGANVWVHTARNGSNPVWGAFTLSFRENAAIEASFARSGAEASAASGLAGSFGTSFGALAPSRTGLLRHDASAREVEAALESLGSIDDVVVERSPERQDGGYMWTITFVEVRRLTLQGWVFDVMSNLEALVAGPHHLHGTGAALEVGHREGGRLDYPSWAPKAEGSFGEATGAAYVYQRDGISRDQYVEVAKVTAWDANAWDRFGWSVSLSGGGRPWGVDEGTNAETGFGNVDSGRRPMLVVGAPFKDDKGVLEQQALSCVGDGGYFTVSFRGFTSDPIPWNVSHAELVGHLRSDFGPCVACHAGATADPMPVFPAIDVEPWGDAVADADGNDVYPGGGSGDDDAVGNRALPGLCSSGGVQALGKKANATRAVITFLTPAAHAGTGGDLELLTVDFSGLELNGVPGAGNATVAEVRKGSALASGPEAKGAQKGAVYVFSSADDDAHGLASAWRQHAKLLLPNGGEADRFGWSVSTSVDGMTIVVGAPGEQAERGAVYVFQRQGSVAFRDPPHDARWGPGEWVRTQRLDGAVFSSDPLDRFGHAVALSPDGDTIVVGAPGVDEGRGAAYVLMRHPYSGVFQMHQELTLGTSTTILSAQDGEQTFVQDPRGRPGDELGCSVAIDVHTAVVGACGRATAAVHTGTLPSAKKQPSSGAAYVYLRPSLEEYFFLSQRLVPSNVKANDRFGHSVAVSNDTVAVSSLAAPPASQGQLVPRHGVQAVTTSAASRARTPSAEPVGSTFTLSWRVRMTGDNKWVVRSTPPIESDASAADLARVLEESLGTGSIRVARTVDADPDTGGHTWYITFAGVSSDSALRGATADGGLPLLEADGSTLTGTRPTVTVTELNRPPTKVRGLVRVFTRADGGWQQTRPGHWKPFVEQAFLYPRAAQPQDLFGSSVALDGEVCGVGAPNRDSFVSYSNGGSAFGYDLDFLRLKFDEEPYEVYEGHGQALTLVRTGAHAQPLQVAKVESLDRNMSPERQRRALDLFGLDDAWRFTGNKDGGSSGSGGLGTSAGGLFTTVADVVGAGTAFGRAQYYGSADPKSIWVDGAYDYRGISDYVPLSETVVVYWGQTAATLTLNTTNDGIVEAPDENVTVAVAIPGMWASLLGSLSSEVVIVDDADGTGAVAATACYEKVYGSEAEASDGLGHSVAVDGASGTMLAGSPFRRGRLGEPHHGSAVVFRQRAGVWEEEAVLKLPKSDAANATSDDEDPDSDDGGGGYTQDLGGEGLSGRGAWGARAKAMFGDSVALSSTLGSPHRRNGRKPVTTALVGAPGLAKVCVFDYNASASGAVLSGWTHAATLKHPEAVYSQHRFGSRGSVAIDQDVAVVGAFGLEAVFLFRRRWDSRALRWTWGEGIKLTSSDYDYDLILDRPYMHVMHFGVAVDVSKRSLAVGAPFADYGNTGSTEAREPYVTDGLHNSGVGRGKVYMYYSVPHQQYVTLRADTQLYSGTFRLRLSDHQNSTDTTDEIRFCAHPREVKAALEALANVDEVEVSYELLDGGLTHRWAVSFLSENDNPPLLEPLWSQTTSTAAGFSGNKALASSGGCGARGVGGCVNMSAPYSAAPQQQLNVAIKALVGDWLEVAALQAADKNSGDRFGEALSLDGDALLVGAPRSDAVTTTTWDFETGDLVGWTASGGTAFDHQPTFGDNPKGRSVYGGNGDRRAYGDAQQSGLEGRYYLGTFELRPGAGRGDYANAHRDYPLGTSRGDAPTGVLTSDPFTIMGGDDLGSAGGEAPSSFVSFLVGGGCDAERVYVELLVDGYGVDRATGKCSERMEAVTWDLGLYAGRTAQVRVVDGSSGPWGHISVDRFVFSWSRANPSGGVGATSGGQVTGRTSGDSGGDAGPGRGAANGTLSGEAAKRGSWPRGYDTSGAGGSGGQKVHRGMAQTAPDAGAAYAFRRRAVGSSAGSGAAYTQANAEAATTVEFCSGDKELLCGWVQEAKLLASDRRAGDRFGSSVAVDDAAGYALVGAPLSSGASRSSLLSGIVPSNSPHAGGSSLEVEVPMDGAGGSARGLRAATTHTALGASLAAVTGQVARDAGLTGWKAGSELTTRAGLPASRTASGLGAARANVAQPGYDDRTAYDPRAFDGREFELSGSAYVFTRSAAVRGGGTGLSWRDQNHLTGEPLGGVGATVEEQRWQVMEQMRLAPSAAAARDGFGSWVAMDGDVGFVGSPGDDGIGTNAGALHFFDLLSARVFFDSAQYVGVEGSDNAVVVTVSRDAALLDRSLTIAFATSDLTAKGVDTLRFNACLDLPVAEREGCGDYLQTAGELTFGAGDATVSFVVYLLNDLCHEHHAEYVLLTLSVPGAGRTGGEDYTATLRIDDDDLERPACYRAFI